MKLTNRQKRFVQEYMIDLNAFQAAGRAGYKNREKGRQLVSKGNVSEAIQAAMKEKSKRANLTIQNIIDDLRRMAKSSEDAGQFGPAIKALELLGKHLGMFIDKHEISAKDNAIKIIVEYAADQTETATPA